MKMPSQMKHSFANVPEANIRRSSFRRPSSHKTTMSSGVLYPIFCDEVYPGDTFNMKLSLFARINPTIAPIMDNLRMDVQWFYVPSRILWDNFQKFHGEQIDPGDSTDYLIPQIAAPSPTGFASQTLFDYFGIPLGKYNATDSLNLKVNALPFRAYNLIWNEWYRSQDLQDSLPVSRGDGPDLASDYVLKKRGKAHDYFTSGLPFPQKGPAASFSLGGTIPVDGIGAIEAHPTNTAGSILRTAAAPYNFIASSTGLFTDASGYFRSSSASGTISRIDNSAQLRMNADNVASTLNVDLSSATAVTVNTLRQAITVQQMYELDARGGTRYTEIIRSHFGVISPDGRLQRPEFLGGQTININVAPIVQTSESASTPQGNLAGMGTASMSNSGFMKSFTEHGYIIGLASTRGDISYQSGLEKMWSRRSRFDFYYPTFANLGEQAVLNKEIYAQALAADNDVFCYQERWAELRYKQSYISGAFRSDLAGSLDYWHLAEDFDTLPTLSDTFIQDGTPMLRIMNVTNEPELLVDTFFDLTCVRPLPTYSVPGLTRL